MSNVLSIQYKICPICNSTYKVWAKKYADNINFQICQCINCEFAFINPRPNLKWLEQWYSLSGHHTSSESISLLSYDEIIKKEIDFPNSSMDAKRILHHIKSVIDFNQGNKLLDVGSGYGFFTKEAILNNFEVTAIELAEFEKSISVKLTNVQPVSTTFENFDSKNELFTVVLFSQILEHAEDVNNWLKKANSLLVNGGVIAIALPNFNSFVRLLLGIKDPYIIPPAHLNYFNSKSLSHLLLKSGFEVQKIETVSRIPLTSFSKRKFLKIFYLDYLFYAIFLLVLKIMDFFRLGIMLNVYAKKTSDQIK
jgi:2-polyprenyl-3-methyl-5-hydroxy-6-metoxy-1,4-benzoquinol methylase